MRRSVGSTAHPSTVAPGHLAAARARAFVALGLAGCLAGLAALTGCSKQPGSTRAFCAQIAKVPALESTLARFSETDPDVLDERIEKARAAYARLADVAPSKIDSDTDEVVALVDEVLDAVADNPSDPAKAADQLRTAMADHQDAAAARERVAAYAQEHCDVQLDPTLTEGPPTTTSTPPSTTAGGGASTTSTTASSTASTVPSTTG